MVTRSMRTGPAMRWITRIAAAALCAGLQACVTPPASAPEPRAAPVIVTDAHAPVTILVSIDGFRADYLDRGVTPNLSTLAASGVHAAMRPSFPSKTFPNHWTIVTGLRPDRNGIVANTMEDGTRPGETFTMATRRSLLVERSRADLGHRGKGGDPHRDDVLAGRKCRLGRQPRPRNGHTRSRAAPGPRIGSSSTRR